MSYTIRQFQLLAEFFEKKAKDNYDAFTKISNSIITITNFDFFNANQYTLKELGLHVYKIVEHFENKNFGVTLIKTLSSAGNLVKDDPNLCIAERLSELYHKICNLTGEEFNSEIKVIKSELNFSSKKEQSIFIGHGRSKLWSRVALFIKEELKISTFSFETESRTSESIINILASFLNSATFAIFVLTAEDETAIGTMRARQNVIHEAGLFQGKLGFEKVILLKDSNIEDLSNLAGLQYIQFTKEDIEKTFYELVRVLRKNGLVK